MKKSLQATICVQELLEELDISGCIIVADALNCQKDTAKAVIAGEADYLFCVKDNQPCLKQDIADYIGDTALRGTMDRASQTEKNRDRIDRATQRICYGRDRVSQGQGRMGRAVLYRRITYGV